ncbi:hypothetical protein [Micromonospora sp. NPDC003816]|uniref:hypothetical protein n=1 Tax=Micromonospora sp. NPDC003816 TaxID=3364224 RepID=UPI0036B0ABD4
MGARLVSLVLARWAHLPDRAFRVVVKMAHTALDEATDKVPAGLYFGGREALADILRNERGGKRESVLRNVRFAIEEAIAAGAIKRQSKGRVGSHAVYRMTLDGPRSIDKPLMYSSPDDGSQGESSVPPQEECHVPPEGESSVPPRGNATFPPRNHDEPGEEPREEVGRDVLPVGAHVLPTGGHAGPQTPRRPDDPSGRRTSSDSATFAEEQQPPQPETATHDRTRESAPPPPLRLVPGNPDVVRSDDEPRSIFPAPVPGTPQPTGRGFGFCLPCHRDGMTTLAADPVSGDACLTHLRSTG